MKRRICMVLALMIALMLSVCAVADEYETAALTLEEEETPVISAESVDEEVGEAKEADLDDLPEVDAVEEQPVIEEQPEEEASEEEAPAVVEKATEEELTEEEPAEKGSLPEGAGSLEGETEGVPSDEEPAEAQPAEEEPIEEQSAEEESSEVESAEEQPDEEPEEVVEAETVEEQPEVKAPVANELTYTGEAQVLISAQGAWLYSLDGESYGEDIPTAVDAGEYTVYYKADTDAERETLTITMAKADVTFTPPVAAFIEE